MDRGTGRDLGEAPRILGDLHRHSVDVEGEGDESDALGHPVAKAGRRGIEGVPSEFVQHLADAVARVDVALLQILNTHEQSISGWRSSMPIIVGLVTRSSPIGGSLVIRWAGDCLLYTSRCV